MVTVSYAEVFIKASSAYCSNASRDGDLHFFAYAGGSRGCRDDEVCSGGRGRKRKDATDRASSLRPG